MEFKEIVRKRYATKKFTGKKIPQELLEELLEMIRMAPSSYGLQPWKVVVIEDQALKEKLLPVSFNQAQITSCSHLLVFCANTDLKGQIDEYERMMKQAGVPAENVKQSVGMMRDFNQGLSPEDLLCWVQRQTYLAVGNAVNGAKSLGFDSCPMEGFQPEEYKKMLELPVHLVPCVLATIGYAADVPRAKIRYAREWLFMKS